MNTSLTKVSLAYKLNKNLFKDMDPKMTTRLLNNIFDLKVGATSILSENLSYALIDTYFLHRGNKYTINANSG